MILYIPEIQKKEYDSGNLFYGITTRQKESTYQVEIPNQLLNKDDLCKRAAHNFSVNVFCVKPINSLNFVKITQCENIV